MPVCLENSIHQSDSESDEDYVPPQGGQGIWNSDHSFGYTHWCTSDSDSEHSDKEDAVVDVDKQGVTTDTETRKRRVVFIFSYFFGVDVIIETFDENGFDHH